MKKKKQQEFEDGGFIKKNVTVWVAKCPKCDKEMEVYTATKGGLKAVSIIGLNVCDKCGLVLPLKLFKKEEHTHIILSSGDMISR